MSDTAAELEAPELDARTQGFLGKFVTALLVFGPVLALAGEAPMLWGHLLHLRDVIVGAAFFVVTGFGVTVGYHRLFAHRSFRPRRWLKIVLAAVGSCALEGSVTGWVANHRRHHRFSDAAGDPHSPHLHGPGLLGNLRGFGHAHVGWLFTATRTSVDVYASDLAGDPDMACIARLFPLFAIGSLAIPFFLGWGLSGTIGGALTMLLWAGLIRVMLLHHVTWSVNSVCHMFGSQPSTTRDSSRNFAPLALVSFGEAWHNFHHAFPRSARHGAQPRQLDPSAALIGVFERLGWATDVHWPTPKQLSAAAPS
jgi:stearoyl-CoA desaturase (Delta-9 desaturase)